MLYIASPYSHPDPEVVEERFLAVEKFTAQQMAEGFPVYSPIVHCHALATKYNMPTTADFWWDYNKAFLEKADCLQFLMLDGWRDSVGVAMELNFCFSKGIIITKFSGETFKLVY